MQSADAVREHAEARARGARHEAVAVRARYALETGDLDGTAFGADKPLHVARRRIGSAAQPPIAFLASFGGGRHVVFALQRGVTRVGRGIPFGDFELPDGVIPIEGRQFLVVERAGQVLVMDDHSTNQSMVLPRTAPRLEGVRDPRWDDGVYSYPEVREKAPQAVALDWAGTVVCEIKEGDVLLTMYSALVFGWLRRDPT
jgi:hypothetical protein